MNPQAYLERIGGLPAAPPSREALTRLQAAHLLAVPFENLDIHGGRPICLANSFAKIVTHRRGGFCYELNSLFGELLRALGYQVKLVAARVYAAASRTYGPEFDHLALIVTLPEADYLVDMGFGEFTLHPLRLQLGQPQTDPQGQFRLEPLAEELVVQKLDPDSGWVPEYSFSLTARALADFEPMCHYHQTSPASHFTRKKLCTLPTPEGRLTLTGQTLKISRNGVSTEYELTTPATYAAALAEHFGIREA